MGIMWSRCPVRFEGNQKEQAQNPIGFLIIIIPLIEHLLCATAFIPLSQLLQPVYKVSINTDALPMGN